MKKIEQYLSGIIVKHIKLAVALTITIFCCYTGFAQAANITNQFEAYTKENPQEKLFVHVNKNFFVAGEIVWFKIYARDDGNKATALSKVAYIEVIDRDKKPVLQAKIRLMAGSGNGSFQLPTSINSGNYTIRAYTAWMKNFGPDLYFSKPITIVNTFKSLDIANDDAGSQAYDIQFFPEGGNLVNNIPSKVAFRITDIHGKGVDCNGTVTDKNNNTVSTFKPLKFGIGSFSFTPAPGNSYTAVVNVGGKSFTQPLPQALSSGYAMHVSEAGTTVSVNVSSSSPASNNLPVYLVVHTGKTIKVAEAKPLQNSTAVFTVDKAGLGDGISHFTIFDNAQQPVCERLYFKQPVQTLLVDATADQQDYYSRGKINIDINTKDENGAAQLADMSMSVYRLDSLQTTDDQDIVSSLLLTSDLKGNVESPAYYFTNKDAETNEALDNVMLTHGWSRFKWADVLSGKQTAFEFVPEYEGHLVKGKIIDKRTNVPAENIVAYLSVPGKNFRLAVSKSDHNGVVQFNVKDYVGGDAVILQTNQQQDSTYRIDIANPFSEKFSAIPLPEFKISGNVQNSLVEHSIGTQAQNAFNGEKIRQFFAVDVDTVPFFGTPSQSYLLDDYTRFNTMEEVLREYVPGIAVRKHRDGFHLLNLDDPHNTFFDDNPLVLVDGVPFFNMDTVIGFNPLKIRKLDVVTNKYYLGPLILAGVDSYTTYKGDLDGIQLDPSSIVVEYDGMQLQREFYVPKYDTPKEQSSRLPDLRDVLYWSPDVKTGSTGKTRASFYTSDLKGKFAIVIQGITPSGRAGSKTFFVNVK